MGEVNGNNDAVANLSKGLVLLTETRDATTTILEEMKLSSSLTPYSEEMDRHICRLFEQVSSISENIDKIRERLRVKNDDNEDCNATIEQIHSQSLTDFNNSVCSSTAINICRNYLTKGFCLIQDCRLLHSSGKKKKKVFKVENDEKMEVYDPSVEYQPQDESRICKFFMKDGKCWKKACSYEHVRTYKWTHDTVGTFCYPYNTLILPEVGTKLDLLVTGIESVVKLYCQLPKEYSDIGEGISYFETLSDLERDMNSKSVIPSFTSLPVDPAEGETVIARVDRYWYRATVISIEDSEVTVFLCDYGSVRTIPLSDLRSITPRFLHLPFQAVACQLDNIAYNINSKLPLSELSVIGNEFLSERILHETISATVHFKDVDNECIIISASFNGRDIGEVLIEEGFCIPFKDGSDSNGSES